MNIYKEIHRLPQFKNAVITIGSFDGVHTGHQKILSRLTQLADEIQGESVVITFYPHPRNVVDSSKSDISVLNTLDEKLHLLKKYGIQNVVVVPFSFEFSRQSPREYIEKFIISNFNPAYVVIGYDHKFGLNRAGDISLFRQYEVEGHFKVIEIPKHEIEDIAISSTKIRKALMEGDTAFANEFLGYPFQTTGKVVHGDKLGTKLGYPTANLQIEEKDKLIPSEGVYAVKIEIEQAVFEGMMYIGKRPSVTEKGTVNIEINIFDFSQNIYDKTIQISILKYLRGDIKFDNLDALKLQLKADEQQALQVHQAEHVHQKQVAKASIVILNYNGAELLESYLPMMEYSSSKYDVDIVLIDNHSDDLSVDFVNEWYPEVKIVPLSKNYGFAEGYNKGLKNIDTEYTVIINSDVLVTENWLDPILDKMDKVPTIGIVQPKIKSIEHKDFFEYAGCAGGYIDTLGYPFCRGRLFDTVEKDQGQYDQESDIFWASGACMVVRTKLFKTLGGFDGGFFAHQEEIDHCWKVKKAGYTIQCMPQSMVYHLGGGTLEYQNPRKDFLNFRNNLYMLAKNETITKLAWLIPLKLILDGIAGIKFLLDKNPKSTLAVIKAHMSFYIHLPLLVERRNKEFHWIRKAKIGPANTKGSYGGSIIWKYFVERKTKFSDLNF